MSDAFDVDTQVTDRGGGLYEATISPRWNIGDNPNGGYLMALLARAAGHALPKPDPLSVTAHFLRPPRSGPATIDVERIRAGRTHATAMARLEQDGTERLRLLGVFGDLRSLDGPTVVSSSPPDLPDPDDCLVGRPPMPGGRAAEISDRFDYRLDPAAVGWSRGQPTGRAEVAGWVRFADGREPDLWSLLLVVDVLPPTVFDLGLTGGWVPTIELTAHLRGHPAPGWLRIWTRTRFLIGGYLEEDAEVWDAKDRLVAQSRQLALLPRTS